MTTPAAANLYLAEHLLACEGKNWAVVNPKNRPVAELPVIYGFNNGGQIDLLQAMAIAEDGTVLAQHICSAEGYMLADLGVLEGTSPSKHVEYLKRYPDGYRMEFVGYSEIELHAKLQAAFKLAKAKIVKPDGD